LSVSKFKTITSSRKIKVIGIENKVFNSGDTLYGDLNFSGHGIKNLGDPENDTVAVNKRFIDPYIRFRERIPIDSKLAIILELTTI